MLISRVLKVSGLLIYTASGQNIPRSPPRLGSSLAAVFCSRGGCTSAVKELILFMKPLNV